VDETEKEKKTTVMTLRYRKVLRMSAWGSLGEGAAWSNLK
jgi:hypothetical protein